MKKKKIIRFAICEGKSEKTEVRFLEGYKSDRTFIIKVNKNQKLENYLSNQSNELRFEFKKINYKQLRPLLDSIGPQSYLVIYVDRDQKDTFKYVQRICQEKNISDNFDASKNKIFVYPSPGNAFEELLCCFFDKPKKMCKQGNNIAILKKKLGEDFKSSKNIYKKVTKEKNQETFLNHMNEYKDKKIFNLLRIKI